MKKAYLKHPIIATALLLVGWLSLLLPLYLLEPAPEDYQIGEAVFDYSRYTILALAFSCVCVIPIAMSSVYLGFKKSVRLSSADRFILLVTYIPALGISALNLCIALDGISNLPAFILPAVLYTSLLIFLTVGFPRQTNG